MRLSELEEKLDSNELNPFYISFSDLMVLMTVFFLMLISMSKIEIGSFEKIRTGFTGSNKNTLVELSQNLKNIVEGDPGIPGVKVRMAEDGVRLDLDTAALFDTGSAVLKKDSLTPLKPLFDSIIATKYTIDVEGHTDDRSFYRKNNDEIETNWSLSGRRASSVVNHLLDFGFKSSRLRIVGYAANRPIAEIKDKEGEALDKARGENRRVSILVR